MAWSANSRAHTHNRRKPVEATFKKKLAGMLLKGCASWHRVRTTRVCVHTHNRRKPVEATFLN